MVEDLPSCIPWIYSIFGSCMNGYRDAFSLFFGYFSICCWLCAHIPQIRESYQLKNGDGLSIYLLFFWLTSDFGTLLGCFLNHQLLSQMLLQSVFLTLDLIMISQYFYYGKPNIVKEEAIEETLSVAESSDYGSFSKKSRSATSLMGLMLFGMPWSSLHTNSITTSSSNGITFGIILAWSCVSLDIGSRFPQFFKNWKRSSVEGVSNLLLIWALAGNFSYGSSIVLHPGRTENEFWETFPYIFGSAVTLCLDMLLYGQFLYYIRKKSQANAIVV